MTRAERPAASPLTLCGGALVVALLLLAACRSNTEPSKPPDVCTKVGQRCEYSPGKLGTCVARDDCKTGDCFVCQSQH